MNRAETLKRFVNNTAALVKFLFKDSDGKGVILTPIQLKIVNSIFKKENNRYAIAAYTQYGKSFIITISVMLRAIFYGETWNIISPLSKQSMICYTYVLEFISRNKFFKPLLRTYKRDIKELSRLLNRENITLGKGLIRILTCNVNKKGEGLLGFSGNILEDESAAIPDDIERTKIRRMLGGKPDLSHIKISTTHHRGHFQDWTNNPKITNFKVDYKVGLREGRITQEFIDLQREEMSEEEFGIWYECEFPGMDSNAFFSLEDVDMALINVKDWTFNGWYNGEVKVLSVDVARFGGDRIAFTETTKSNGEYYSRVIESYDKSSTTNTAGKIIDHDRKNNYHYIVVDATGLGGGVCDMLVDHGLKPKLIEFNAGEKPLSNERAFNLGSEAYIYYRELVRKKLAHLKEHHRLRNQMLGITYEFTMKAKMHVNKKGGKPDSSVKSPDELDSAVMSITPFIKQGGESGFAFV